MAARARLCGLGFRSGWGVGWLKTALLSSWWGAQGTENPAAFVSVVTVLTPEPGAAVACLLWVVHHVFPQAGLQNGVWDACLCAHGWQECAGRTLKVSWQESLSSLGSL